MRTLMVAIVLIFTLGIGIALGTGPLGDKIDEHRHPAKAGSSPGTSGSDPIDSALAASVAPTVLSGKLTGQSVAVIALPGVPGSTLTALGTDIVAAGGAVASTTTLTEALTDNGEKAMIESLGTQVEAQMPGVVDASLTTYPRIGALLGAAVTTTGPAAAATPAAATLRETFQVAKLIQEPVQGNLGTLTLVVAGSRVDTPILTGLLTGLRSKSRGVVLAGTTRARVITSVRAAAPAVGTFDGIETDAGRIGSVLLLARQITSAGGSFGASGSDGTLPLG